MAPLIYIELHVADYKPVSARYIDPKPNTAGWFGNIYGCFSSEPNKYIIVNLQL